MITNGEYLEFVESGGYEDEKFWTEEGWKWKVYRQSKHPVFWVCNHGEGSGHLVLHIGYTCIYKNNFPSYIHFLDLGHYIFTFLIDNPIIFNYTKL